MPQLEKSIANAYRSQINQDETLVTPLSCANQTASDNAVGTEVKQATITESLSCNAYAYKTGDFQYQVKSRFNATIVQQLGISYVVQGISAAIMKTEIANGDIQFIVSVHGAVIYRLSQSEKTRLIHTIAGKNRQNALSIILHTAGIASASTEAAQLPANPDHIRVVVARS